eukprot:2537010-Rhodomonas_salina.7
MKRFLGGWTLLIKCLVLLYPVPFRVHSTSLPYAATVLPTHFLWYYAPSQRLPAYALTGTDLRSYNHRVWYWQWGQA